MIRTLSGLRPTGPAVLVMLVALLVPLAACNRGQTASDVMAKVNGRKILRSEVDKYYANQTASSPQQPSDEQATSLKLGILKELIDNEILMQRAEKLGLLATNEEVDQKLNEIKAPYTQEEFDKRLKERKISLDDFKRDLRRSITIDKVLNREITSKIAISDADISSYYNAHKGEFNLIEPQYHLAHIFVSTQPNPQVRNLKGDKAQNEADARKKIQMIMNRLDSGEDFATVAMNYSEDSGERRQWRRFGLHPAIGAGQDRSGHARRGQQTQAGPVQQHRHHRQPGKPAGVRLPHRQGGGQGTGGPARAQRPAGAAGHPRPIARPPRATAQGRLLRRRPRPGQGRELLRRADPEEHGTKMTALQSRWDVTLVAQDGSPGYAFLFIS